jgi:tetratricopeptide (TPR) repeat protein
MSAPSPASAPAAPEAATGHEGQAESYHARGLAALDQGRLQDAKNLLQHAAKISRAPEHEAAFALTRALLAEQQQQYEEALELLKVAAKLDRSERVAAAYRRIGELAKGKGRLFRR